MRRIEHGAPSALCGLAPFTGLALAQIAAAVELVYGWEGDGPASPHRAEPHHRRLHRGGDASVGGRTRRWSARVRNRAAGRAPPALPSPRRRAPRQRAPRCSRARRAPASARRGGGSAGSTTSPCSPTARPCSPTTRSTRPRSGCSRLARPDLVVADHVYAGVASASGLEVVAFADLDAVALAVAAWQGRAVRIVPLDDRRPPAAYAGLLDLLESLTSAELDPLPALACPQKPARSCSFATRAAGAYAHPAEKRGIRKG